MINKPVISQVSASFTRPADTTAYAQHDLVANSTTAGDVDPMQFVIAVGNGRGIKIVQAKVQKSGTTITNGTFDLHLFGTEPTVANGDNGALSVDTASFIGEIAFPLMTAYTDDGMAMAYSGSASGQFPEMHHRVTSSNVIYGLLQANAAYTPASAEVFTVTLTIEQY